MIFQWLILGCIGGRGARLGSLVFTSGWAQESLMMVALLLTQGHQFSTCQAKLQGINRWGRSLEFRLAWKLQ